MAETITKQLWSEFNGKGFEAESAKYAERASCDAMDNDLTLTITNSKVNAIGGCNLAAETAIKDSEGNPAFFQLLYLCSYPLSKIITA